MTSWPIGDPKSTSILESPSRRRFLRGAGVALSASLAGGLTGCGGNQSVKLTDQRRQAAWRRRRIILDDDGDLCYSEDAEKSVEAFLAQRFVPILETPVDSIAWCIMWAIAIGKGKTRYWETQQLGKPLNPVISDPTPVMAEAARSRQVELFGSLRMNDTHDSYGMPAGKLIYPLKVEHPEWLLGDESMKGPVFSSRAAAIWSGLDFAVPQVREDRLWWIRNTVEKYDVAGVDLNFFRMPWYFKTGREEEGMPLMTELIRSARKVLDRESERRGRPLLLGIRSPGTVAACRRIGIDIETWLKEGLVDRLLIGGGYVPFTNPAEELVQLGHRHQVPVYPCINCGTQMFGSDAAFRGSGLQHPLGRSRRHLSLELPIPEGAPDLLRASHGGRVRGPEPHRLQRSAPLPGQDLRHRLRSDRWTSWATWAPTPSPAIRARCRWSWREVPVRTGRRSRCGSETTCPRPRRQDG